MQISEETVRKVVMEVLSGHTAAPAAEGKNGAGAETEVPRLRDPSGILQARIADVPLAPFEGRKDVRLRDIASLEEAPRIGCGIMELDPQADFEWALHYDEWDVILEGRLEIQIDGRVIAGEPGDVIYIPRGSHIRFTAPVLTRFVYTVFPADW